MRSVSRGRASHVGLRREFCIAIGGRNFFGAERRFFRIASKLLKGDEDRVQVQLMVNSSLYVSAKKSTWGASILKEFEQSDRLVVLPDSFGGLWSSRSILRGFRLLLGSSSAFHAVFRARALAYFRAAIGREAVVEVTSVTVAGDIALRAPSLALRRISAFRCVSDTVADRLTSAFEERYSQNVAAGLSAKVRRSASPYFEQLPEAPDLVSKEKLIVSASRFIPRKNVDMIARALAQVLPALPDWSAHIMGQGDQEQEIRSILGGLIAEGRVKVSYESDVESVFSRSSIYVSAISPDNYPSQSVLEAAARGNALVLSNNGDSGRFICGGENGDLVAQDEQSLAASMERLASDETRLRKMQLSSIKHMDQSFSTGRHIDDLLAVHGILR